MRSIGSPYMDKGKWTAFLKKPSTKESWRIAESEQTTEAY
jgi:hypothetical protein